MPTIILDHPQMGENIGAAARAMLNFGLNDLRLVAPRDGWPNERAVAMASGAFSLMPPVKVFETLEEALGDMHFVLAATARPRDMVKAVYTPAGAVKELREHKQSGENIGILFGAERTGLLNDDIARANGIITIPTNPDFPALNLGQSVLLMSYEWNKNSNSDVEEKVLKNGDAIPATHQELEHYLYRLETALEEDGRFFRSENLMPTMKRNIRNIFMRNNLTQQEVRTLQGILSAILSRQT